MNNDSAIQALKAYLFPTIVSILSAMIWYDVSEIKQDIKVLMAQSNIDKTRIDNIEKQIDRWHSASPTSNIPMNAPQRQSGMLLFNEFILDMPRKRLLVEEEAKKKPQLHA